MQVLEKLKQSNTDNLNFVLLSVLTILIYKKLSVLIIVNYNARLIITVVSYYC